MTNKTASWWQGAILYQIYPRSFADANGDGIGDLNGIRAKLGHVASLNVDGIWLSPFFTSPMKDFGYDVSDYHDVDPTFGTLADFDALLAEAHDLGLKVIIDQVYSHSSDQHAWFSESRASRDNPKANWYVWADPKPDGTPPNNWLAVFGGPSWDWDSRRQQYYFHNFLSTQPDLNFHEPEVQAAILEVARFWLDRGVDGFRLDVANFFCHDLLLRDNPAHAHPSPVKPYWMQRQLFTRDRPETLAFVARLRSVLDEYPGAMSVAEIASDDQIGTMVAYTDGPDRYHTAYSFVFLRDAFGAGHIRRSIETMQAASSTAWPSWAFSNHDVERVVSRWGRDADEPAVFAKLMIALLASLRGTIFLYQGEELGLPQGDVPFEKLQDPEAKAFWPHHRGRDGCRTPMPWQADAPSLGFSPPASTKDGATVAPPEPWLPLETRHGPLAMDRQDQDPNSTLTFTRRFLAWRRTQPALITGDITFLDAPEPVLAFVRTAGDDRVLCVFNLGKEPAKTVLTDTEEMSEASPALANASAFHHTGLVGSIADGVVTLPGYGAVFAALAPEERRGPS